MTSNRDTVLSDFVRMKLRDDAARRGRKDYEIANDAGFNKSIVAAVKKGVGVGAKTAPGFARAFGYASVEAMVDAAYEWRRGSGSDLDELLAEPAVQEAMDLVKTLVAGATDESLRSILAAFLHPRLRGRDRMWWVELLGKEAKRDADEAMAHQIERETARRDREHSQRSEEAMWRDAGRLKQREEAAHRSSAVQALKRPRKSAG